MELSIAAFLAMGFFGGVIISLLIVIFSFWKINKNIKKLKQEVMEKNDKEKEEYFKQKGTESDTRRFGGLTRDGGRAGAGAGGTSEGQLAEDYRPVETTDGTAQTSNGSAGNEEVFRRLRNISTGVVNSPKPTVRKPKKRNKGFKLTMPPDV